VPALAVAARRTANDCLVRIEQYPEHLHALAEGRPSPLPAPRTLRLDAGRRWLITSDLHRCVPGRTDWPERQHTKALYAHMLEHYAERGWGLIENGDVEDFWMVGGSAWGAVYDIARIAGGVAAVFDDSMRLQLFAEQLDRTVDNNALTYRLIREGFLADGRYHRTMGNHDEAYDDPVLVARLDEHLGGVDPVDTILLVDGDTDRNTDRNTVDRTADGRPAHPGVVQAVVSHGHLTDSWNGPGYSPLGRAITWLALGLDDLPTPAGSEGLPDEQAVDRLLSGRGRNRLVTLDPRFGGNRRFDSLDEERLFARLAEAEPEPGWPWMLFGHTHYPMLWPVNAEGDPVRYANSGCGVLDHTVSALEWDPGGGDDPVHLVMWTDDGTGPRRVELVADGAALQVV